MQICWPLLLLRRREIRFHFITILTPRRKLFVSAHIRIYARGIVAWPTNSIANAPAENDKAHNKNAIKIAAFRLHLPKQLTFEVLQANAVCNTIINTANFNFSTRFVPFFYFVHNANQLCNVLHLDSRESVACLAACIGYLELAVFSRSELPQRRILAPSVCV